ncbi:MAG: LD-carboxypeptidase [Saprospiraceae bacterium]
MDRRTFSKKIASTAALAGFPLIGFGKQSDMSFSKKIIKPKRLKPGDTIGLVTPASPITKEQLEKTIKNIEGLGFKLEYNRKRLLARKGYLAGKDIVRADEINRMFDNKRIDGIWCVRGGYGATRMLDMLNYKVIKQNPKVLIGYSDVTALYQAIFKKTGLVCFHGPVGASDFTNYTKKHVQKILSNPTSTYKIEASPENEAMENQIYNSYVINDGIAEGRLVGGNLTLVSSLVGTPYDISYKNKLVFLEDIGEKPYRIDRMITQMTLAGKFDKVKGIILGVFLNCETKDGNNSLTLMEMFKDRFEKLKVPIIYGMSFGHISNQFTLPLGIQAKLDTTNKTLTLLEPAVV